MSRIVVDKTGAFDLAHVSVITAAHWQTKGPNNTVATEGDHAKLYIHGMVFHTTLDYEAVRDAWLDVKAAENHPSDSDTAPVVGSKRPSPPAIITPPAPK